MEKKTIDYVVAALLLICAGLYALAYIGLYVLQVIPYMKELDAQMIGSDLSELAGLLLGFFTMLLFGIFLITKLRAFAAISFIFQVAVSLLSILSYYLYLVSIGSDEYVIISDFGRLMFVRAVPEVITVVSFIVLIVDVLTKNSMVYLGLTLAAIAGLVVTIWTLLQVYARINTGLFNYQMGLTSLGSMFFLSFYAAVVYHYIRLAIEKRSEKLAPGSLEQ